ncbi:MAG: hypothetical protein PHO83_15085 [Geobacteraceae bacterium]|nr:hypothetical protein [Geobacteraceae bacterium]
MNNAAILKVPSALVAKAVASWSYRRFATVALCFLGGFLFFHLVTWKCFTEDLLTDKYHGGDLSRMGYLAGSKHYRKTFVDLPRRHLEMRDYHGQRVDMLTIGDSFSFGGGRGRNPHYQDYIASLNKLTVMNVMPYPTDDLVMGCSPLSTLAVLDNSGYLDIIKPRYVLIESLETLALARFARPFKWTWTDSLANVVRHYAGVSGEWPALPKVSFINSGNLDFYWRTMMYQFSDNALGHTVFRRQMDRTLFSVSKGTDLLFYQYDLQVIPFTTSKTIAEINDTMNHVAEILARKGIRLIFMPVVSKYDLYSEFIVDNPYPASTFFEKLRPLPKNYLFIDTKAVLQEEVRKGVQDVFFADDTHWSWKASQILFEKERFR